MTEHPTKPILDQGYLRLVETWGADEQVVEAARMSTGKGFLGWDPGPCGECGGTGKVGKEVQVWDVAPERVKVGVNKAVLVGGVSRWDHQQVDCHVCGGKGSLAGDAKLLAYLYSNRHHTPFEMAGLVTELQAPIAVFREWHRHRTQSYNEMSARYMPLPDVNYVPTPERCLSVSGTNRQAGAVKGSDEITHESAIEWLEELAGAYDVCEKTYQSGLRRGVPKEVARLCVPVGRYSRMRACANLRNWLAFLTLRMDAKAQWEIRQYANAVGELVADRFPRTWKLFTGGQAA